MATMSDDPLGLTAEQRWIGEREDAMRTFMHQMKANMAAWDALPDDTILHCAGWCPGHRLGDLR